MLRAGLARFAGWRLRAMNGGRLPKRLVIDIDSLPVEVHGAQPGSEWNGHYHARIYHPQRTTKGHVCLTFRPSGGQTLPETPHASRLIIHQL